MNTPPNLLKRKLKRNSKTAIKLDPAGYSVKASMNEKVEKIYDMIKVLNNKDCFLQSFISSARHATVNKPIQMGKQSIKQASFGQTTNVSTLNGISQTDKSYFSKTSFPTTTFKGMMLHKAKMEEDDAKRITENPFYKIMKKRVKTCLPSELESHQKLSQTYRKEINITELDHSFSDEEDCCLKSSLNYNSRVNRKPKFERQPRRITRYRSESKSSQEMHEYFDSKYNSFHKNTK